MLWHRKETKMIVIQKVVKGKKTLILMKLTLKTLKEFTLMKTLTENIKILKLDVTLSTLTCASAYRNLKRNARSSTKS